MLCDRSKRRHRTSNPPQVPAAGAGEPQLHVGHLHLVGPSICTDGDRLASAVVRAVHEQPARTALAHLGEGDFLRAGEGGHGRHDPADRVGYEAGRS